MSQETIILCQEITYRICLFVKYTPFWVNTAHEAFEIYFHGFHFSIFFSFWYSLNIKQKKLFFLTSQFVCLSLSFIYETNI